MQDRDVGVPQGTIGQTKIMRYYKKLTAKLLKERAFGLTVTHLQDAYLFI